MRARYDWPETWNVCGAWWGSGCAVVDGTWCWFVMAMIIMQVCWWYQSREVFRWRSDISLMRVAGGKGGTEKW